MTLYCPQWCRRYGTTGATAQMSLSQKEIAIAYSFDQHAACLVHLRRFAAKQPSGHLRKEPC